MNTPSPFAGLMSSNEQTPEQRSNTRDPEKTSSVFARKVEVSEDNSSAVKKHKSSRKRGLVLDSEEEDDEMVLQLDEGDENGAIPMDLEERQNTIIVPLKDKESRFTNFGFGMDGSQRTQDGAAKKQLVSAKLEYEIPMEEAMVEEFPFLRDIRDKSGKRPGTEGYDPSTLLIPDNQFRKLTLPRQQYWEIKMNNFDKVIFFQVGAFYELFAMDADLGLKLLGLKIHSKGSAGLCASVCRCVGAHTYLGFPCNQWEKFALDFLRRGYKVLRVDQGSSDEMKE